MPQELQFLHTKQICTDENGDKMITPQLVKPRVITVSQLNFYIKSLVENDAHLGTVFLTGEISNLTDHYRSGHIYLSLKDEKSVIRAVMFAGNARNLKFKPANGMKVICFGRVAVYEPSGQYQLYIEDMQPDGMGALALAYEQLKEKLSKAGMFEQSHKKPLPRFPKTVGVITSPTGAAVQDIMNILTRRFPSVDIVIAPVLVQGENAPAQLVRAVNTFSQTGIADVIIIGRGGGSIEDLWAFNNEELAYAIYNCKTPVISAVGHETDFTICDFVSDLRAPTPSAAAELAVPDKTELMAYYQSQRQYFGSIMDSKTNVYGRRLSDSDRRIQISSPQNKINNAQKLLLQKEANIKNIGADIITKNSKNLASIASKLESLNPLAVLSRGYAVAQKDDNVITSASQLKEDDVITLTFNDGKINAKVCGE